MASNGNMLQPQLPRFSGKNFYQWSIQMKVLYGSQELWDIVERGYTEVENQSELTNQQLVELRENRKKDKKALFFIYQAVDEFIFERISTATSAKAAWDILRSTYQGEDKVKMIRLQALRSEFDCIKMKETETIEEFFNRILVIVNSLRSNGEEVGDQRVVEKILRSMPRKFEHIVVAIEESKDLSTLSINSLMGSLQSHELRLKQFDVNPEEAFQMQTSFRGGSRGRRGGHGRRGGGRNYDNRSGANSENSQESSSLSRGRGSGRGRGFGRNQGGGRGNFSQIQCFNCGKYGHFQANCWALKNGVGNTTMNMHKEQKKIDEGILFLACSVQDNVVEPTWYLDSGCSNHMTGNRSIFVTLDESFQSEVKTGDNTRLQVKGQGDILVKTKKGTKRVTNVFYVPGLKHNLLSIGQLLQRGLKVSFEGDICAIKDQAGVLIAKVKMTANKMFPLNFTYGQISCFSSILKDPSWLWHFRYGHLNFKSLSYLCKNHMVRGIQNINHETNICEVCILAKHHRDSFPTGKAWRASKPLELIHTDLCGPMRTTTNGGNRYFITFIDDFSRKLWIYFLKEKSEALVCFKSFKAFTENQSGYKIKTLRSDRGGEYIAFGNFFKEQGIHHQMTARMTPQQNGVAERKNRTIMEMARSMLKAKNLPNEFWGDAVACTVYILNRAPTKSVPGMTPYEAWCGEKPSVSHLRVFGSIAYSHIPNQLRGKLDDKSEKCIMVGYSENSKAYRLYNPVSRKIIISRDVIFSEDESWNWNDDVDEAKSPFHVNIDENEVAQELEQAEIQAMESSSSSTSSSTSNDEISPRRMRSIQEIYNTTNRINDDHFANFALFAGVDPVTFDEAIQDEKWKIAMDQEIDAIRRNETWELMELPTNKQALGVKWVYRTKLKSDGNVEKYKARLVVKGYKQEYGVDYEEIFAPVTRIETIRLILSLAAQNGWKVYQMDVKSAFLNGHLKEEIFVAQPLGYVQRGEEEKVYKLKKALYGLKQAPRAWYSRIDSFFLKTGFRRCPYEHALYVKEDKYGKFLIVSLYVDDLLFTGNDKFLCDDFKNSMKNEFEMSDMGLIHYFLGIEVNQNEGEIVISQQKYAHDLLKKFRMENASPCNTPMDANLKLCKDDIGEAVDPSLYRSLVGSLMYLTATRPDILFAVSMLSRFMTNPKRSHWEAGKRVLRYILGTINFGIYYKKVSESVMFGFCDSDWGGNVDDHKSTSGYVFSMGSGVFSWTSKKQSVVALSTTEAEYISLAAAGCQALWLRWMLKELKCIQKCETVLFCDNGSAIALSKNPVFHGRSKHIRIKYHFIRDLVKDGEVIVKYCKTQDQVADIFTKALKFDLFVKFRGKLGVAQV
ncbi:integrase [Cucumis melo var. makuwa]|uniref:Integrase n=1 Tax=Cucumis melo var. makuwa TaxID=1194695 RepID=A0A5A7TA63_CUCMM|nr:integrase [Cucumis melo var. makuwa]